MGYQADEFQRFLSGVLELVQLVGFHMQDIATTDLGELAIVLNLPLAGVNHHFVFVIMLMAGGMAPGLDHEMSHGEILHAVLAAKKDAHVHAFRPIHLDGLGVLSINSSLLHGVGFSCGPLMAGAYPILYPAKKRSRRISLDNSPVLEMLPLGDFQANAFLVRHAEDSGRCWIVDCGPGPEPMLEAIERHGLTPSGIVLTHCHHDHIGGIDQVLAKHGPMPIACHELEKEWNGSPELNLSVFLGTPQTATPPDVILQDGGDCPLGPDWQIIHVPGHSPGSVAFLHGPSGVMIAGDTLFQGSIGRIDFPTSDPQAMRESLVRLMELPDDTQVLPGHGGPTTIGQERAGNPFIAGGKPSF